MLSCVTEKTMFENKHNQGSIGEKGIKKICLADKLGGSYNIVNAYVQNKQQPRLSNTNEYY